MKNNWQIKKLDEVCKIIMGQSPPSDTYNENEIGMPFFQGKAEFTDLYPIARKYCNKPKKIAEPFDILLSVRAPVGTTNIANQQCCIGRGLATLRFENYKYGFYFLRSMQYELDSKGTGTTFRAISGETIRETLIPYPCIETQKAIVSKIEELFSELDKGIEDLKTAKQQLKTYRQSVLKWAFEGKLTNENVKDGELPKGWTLSTIEKVANKITDGEHFRPPTQSDGIAFLSAKDVRDNGVSFDAPLYISEETAKKALQRCNPQLGDILIVSRGATVGRMCIVNTSRQFCLLGSVILIKGRIQVINATFPLLLIVCKYTSFGVQKPNLSLGLLFSFS